MKKDKVKKQIIEHRKELYRTSKIMAKIAETLNLPSSIVSPVITYDATGYGLFWIHEDIDYLAKVHLKNKQCTYFIQTLPKEGKHQTLYKQTIDTQEGSIASCDKFRTLLLNIFDSEKVKKISEKDS